MSMSQKPREPSDCITCKLCGEEFRAITFGHVHFRHGFEGEQPILDYKKMFGLKFVSCREVRLQCRDRIRNYYQRRGQLWTRERVLAEIRCFNPIRKRDKRKLPKSLCLAAMRMFGSWASIGVLGSFTLRWIIVDVSAVCPGIVLRGKGD
jgi:hypothetical protein